jgi:hypothetical protein
MRQVREKSKYSISLKDFVSSAGIAGGILLFRPVLMLFISRGRDPNQYDAIDASAMIQIGYTGIAFLAGFYYLIKSKLFRIILFSTPLQYFFYYSLLGILSTIWSINPRISLYRGFETLAFQMLIVAVFTKLASRLDIQKMITWVMHYAVFIMLLSIYTSLQWSGLSMHTLFREQFNSTPFFFIALFFPAVWYIRYFILAGSVLSQSNTAYAGMSAGLLAFWEGKPWMKLLLFILLSGFIIALFVFGTENILQNTIFYGKAGVGVEYTSGRNQLIEKSIPFIIKNPIIGYGFVAPEIQLITEHEIGIIGVHNAILSSLLGMGLPGLILLVMFFYGMFRISSVKFFTANQKTAFSGTVIIGLFHSIANPGIGSRLYGTWMPVVILFTLISTVYIVSKIQGLINENNLGNT